MARMRTRRPQDHQADQTDHADRQGMELLAAHVPLSLLIDLAPQRGPHSSEILDDERPSRDELAWLAAV